MLINHNRICIYYICLNVTSDLFNKAVKIDLNSYTNELNNLIIGLSNNENIFKANHYQNSNTSFYDCCWRISKYINELI